MQRHYAKQVIVATTSEMSPCCALYHEGVQRKCQHMYTQHHTIRSTDVYYCAPPLLTFHPVILHSWPLPLSSCGSSPQDAPYMSTFTNNTNGRLDVSAKTHAAQCTFSQMYTNVQTNTLYPSIVAAFVVGNIDGGIHLVEGRLLQRCTGGPSET